MDMILEYISQGKRIKGVLNMEKELNVPEINNAFNDEIAAQIKEIESRLEKEEPKNEPQKQTVEIKEPRIVPQVEIKEEVKELKEHK